MADQQQVSSEVEIVQPKQPERAETNVVEIEKQASGDIFERRTGRQTQRDNQQAATMTQQPQNAFERHTGRPTQSVLDQKIEVPDMVKDAKDIAVVLEQ